MSEFAIRPMDAGDEGFVYRAWLEGFWPHSGAPLVMSKSEWLPRFHDVIKMLLRRADGGCIIAHVEGQPASLIGFAASGHGCLHWCYIKQAFRGLGIATEMIRRLNLDDKVCSHWSPKLAEHDWKYNPRFLSTP